MSGKSRLEPPRTTRGALSSYLVRLELEADRQVDQERVVELLAGRWCEKKDIDPIAYQVRVLGVEEEG